MGRRSGSPGLITDNASLGNQGIPWLKDVPILGLLAGTQNNTRQRTELLILITPHVIHDQRDARALTDDLRDQLINAAAVPDMLNNLRPSGHPILPGASAELSSRSRSLWLGWLLAADLPPTNLADPHARINSRVGRWTGWNT